MKPDYTFPVLGPIGLHKAALLAKCQDNNRANLTDFIVLIKFRCLHTLRLLAIWDFTICEIVKAIHNL